jgi:uncharacterized membrane protein YraQ (UPF0718 family)
MVQLVRRLTALVVFLGLKAGVAVSLSAVTVGFIAGVLIDTLVDPAPRGSAVLPLEPVGGRNQAGCCDTRVGNRARLTLLDFSDPREKARLGARFAIDLLRELGPRMTGGILLAGAIEAVIPKELITTHLGKASLTGLLAALLTAGALYTDSLAS